MSNEKRHISIDLFDLRKWEIEFTELACEKFGHFWIASFQRKRPHPHI